MIPIVFVCLLVAFVVFRGWRGPFPEERHHWQRRERDDEPPQAP